MEATKRTGYFCVVCRKRSHEHSSWFLVIENAWLDRLKILSWHPVLAEQETMHSVCGKRHLETLITHWLTYANLQFEAARMPGFVLAEHYCGPGEDFNLRHPGQFVGELTVHRESASRLWTGSAEAREEIFEALCGGRDKSSNLPWETPLEVESMQPEFAVASSIAHENFTDYAVQQAYGDSD